MLAKNPKDSLTSNIKPILTPKFSLQSKRVQTRRWPIKITSQW